MNIKGLSNIWATKVNGCETAYSVLSENIKEFREGWQESTFDQRIYYFEKLFLPRMNHRPLKDFSIQDIDIIIEDIRSAPTPSTANMEKPMYYDEKTIKGSIVPSLVKLFRIAEQVGVCEDIFWANGRTPRNERKPTDAQHASLPKSIPPKMEKALFNELLTNEKQSGKAMGIMLMFVFGLRNAEACAVTFGCIIEIAGDHYLCSHTSVNAKTAKIEVGGKTCNMYRILPIPDVVHSFLQKRKSYIQELIDSGEIVIDPNGYIKNIQQIPISCSADDFTKPCISADLTLEGRRVFHRIDYDYANLIETKEHVSAGDDLPAYGEERCPTAYLLRRNFGEHLRDLGFTDTEIQYLMGHVIGSDARKRNDFANPDMLKKLTMKMNNRPLFRNIPSTKLPSPSHDSPISLNKNEFEFICELPCDGSTYLISLETEEYHDQIDVSFQPTSRRKDKGVADVTYWSMERALSQAEENAEVKDVCIMQDYLKGY